MCFELMAYRKGPQKPESSDSILCDSDSEEDVRKVGRKHHSEDDRRMEEVRRIACLLMNCLILSTWHVNQIKHSTWLLQSTKVSS